MPHAPVEDDIVMKQSRQTTTAGYYTLADGFSGPGRANSHSIRYASVIMQMSYGLVSTTLNAYHWPYAGMVGIISSVEWMGLMRFEVRRLNY